MTAYVVTEIKEEDFGCEGMPEGYTRKDEVLLRAVDGEKICVKVSDKELYEKNINVGDWVHFDIEGNVIKEQ